MHEAGLMHGALQAVFARAGELDASRIVAIHMRVGRLSGVVPDALQFAFESLVPGTPAEKARLEIETVPVLCYCSTCEKMFQVEDFAYQCPDCAGNQIEIRQGTEFELTSMEVE